MNLLDIKNCPGTLEYGHKTYSRNCLKRVFNGKTVSHILAYDAPFSKPSDDKLLDENRSHISISGVQEKYSLLLEKNKLRLTKEDQQGTYILKPIPSTSKRKDQMPANEHLTMQIAQQVYSIETAENVLIFFKNNEVAYLTKRFDLDENLSKIAQEDFASIAGRAPYTHGEHYKYLGNYLELFQLMKQYVPAYVVEAPKLLRLILFDYLFSNGDAHFKNFSLLETSMGDFKLSPAYDLLNTRIHIEDTVFALSDGLLPKKIAQGKIIQQFAILSEKANISPLIFNEILTSMLNQSEKVKKLTFSSFLDDKTKNHYWQLYQGRLKQLKK